MFSVFAGGAVGTAVAGVLFTSYGWSGAIGGGFGFLGLAVVVLALHARGSRREPAGSTIANDADSGADTRASSDLSRPDGTLRTENSHLTGIIHIPVPTYWNWSSPVPEPGPGEVPASRAAPEDRTALGAPEQRRLGQAEFQTVVIKMHDPYLRPDPWS